jgi:heme/copper-type cytochrome/quinol oxidase subunit 2
MRILLIPRIVRLISLASILAFGGCASDSPIRVDAVNVRLMAQDTSWHASYLIPGSKGSTTELATGREVHVPLGAKVRLMLASRDYISDFTLPELGLRDFAAPGLPSEFAFNADRPGRYNVRGDELCGRPHTEKTRGWLVVEDAASFRAWIKKRTLER